MLMRFGRRGWPHLSESSRSPRRIGAAGVREGDLLGVLLVARRGSGEVEVDAGSRTSSWAPFIADPRRWSRTG